MKKKKEEGLKKKKKKIKTNLEKADCLGEEGCCCQTTSISI